jgi:nucleoredoxin
MNCEGDACTINPNQQVEKVEVTNTTTTETENAPIANWYELSDEEKVNAGKELRKKLEFSELRYFETQTITKKDGTTQDVRVEKSVDYIPNVPYLILYFTASWCPPCKKFSPQLQQFLQNNPNDVDVICITVDAEQYDFVNYVKEYNFKFINWEEQSVIKYLSKRLNVQVLPTCMVVNVANLSVLTKWGREAVANNPTTCIDEWKNNRHGFNNTDVLKFW